MYNFVEVYDCTNKINNLRRPGQKKIINILSNKKRLSEELPALGCLYIFIVSRIIGLASSG